MIDSSRRRPLASARRRGRDAAGSPPRPGPPPAPGRRLSIGPSAWPLHVVLRGGIPYWVVVRSPPSTMVSRSPTCRSEHAIDAPQRQGRLDRPRQAEVVAIALGRSSRGARPFAQLVSRPARCRPSRPEPHRRERLFGVPTSTTHSGAAWLSHRRPRAGGRGRLRLHRRCMAERDPPWLSVTLIRQQAAESTVDPDMGSMVAEALSGMGVVIAPAPRHRSGAKDDRVSAVVTAAGRCRRHRCAGLGVRPNFALARSRPSARRSGGIA